MLRARGITCAALLWVLTQGAPQLAAQGNAVTDPVLQNKLGLSYLHGDGVVADPKQAASWFQLAAEQGHAPSQLMLGSMYIAGSGVERAGADARKWLQLAAKQGDIKAQFLLARVYESGFGTEKSASMASFWFGKAAEGNFSPAQAALERIKSGGPVPELAGSEGAAFLGAVGATNSPTKARAAAPDTSTEAEPPVQQSARAKELMEGAKDAFLRNDYATGFKLAQEGAEMGDAFAQSHLAFYYLSGTGVEKDLPRAYELLQKAAAQGERNAMRKLGQLYAEGSHVSKSPEQAFTWFKKAAELGDGSSQLTLGEYYLAGIGTAVSPAEGVKWIEKAAKRNNATASAKLSIMYGTGSHVPRDTDKAVSWYRKMLDTPRSADVDQKLIAKCKEWITESGKQGHAGAAAEAARLGAGGSDKGKLAILTQSAKAGDKMAILYVAQHYANDLVFNRDSVAPALDWYKSAASHGIAEAQYRWGAHLCEGPQILDRQNGTYREHMSIPVDTKAGLAMLELAAAQNHPGAQELMGNHLTTGRLVPTNPAKAMEWYLKAAKTSKAWRRDIFLTAAGTGNLPTVQKLLEEGVSASSTDSDPFDEKTTLNDILNWGGWSRYRNGHTALMMAAGRKGNSPMVKALLQAGANPNAVDGSSRNVLFHVGDGDTEILRLLLEAGANAKHITDNDQSTLHENAAFPDCVALLLKAGADPNANFADGYPPLISAARGENPERTISLLLAAGADPNVKTRSDGLTPLMFAAEYPRAVVSLLAAGAKVNTLDNYQRNALFYVQDSVESARLLVAAGINVRQLDADGESALHDATESGHTKTAAYLRGVSK
jgi:TPR repeat protein/ankyrin repeat protein